MSDVNELLSLIPVDQIADRLGVDEPTAQAGIVAALPTLLAGMQANAQDPAGEASLASALRTKSPSLVEGGVDLDAVDPTDGAKIVRNVFGDQTDQVVATLGSAPGAQTSGLVQKLLPLLAPIVLSFLAKKFLGGGKGAQGAGGLGDLLGSALGTSGGSTGATSPGGGLGGGLGDLLGGLLGGGRR